MGTLTNGIDTIEWNNPAAPDAAWRKASRTDLDPIVKDSIIVADGGEAKDFGHPRVPDGTRLIKLSDDKFEDAPVLQFTRAELTKFILSAKDGEFDDLLATDEEMAIAIALSGTEVEEITESDTAAA